jgi:FkbM family methyltransferase
MDNAIRESSMNTASAARGHASPSQTPLLTGTRGRLLAACLWGLRRSHLLWRLNFTINGTFGTTHVRIPVVFGNGLQHISMIEMWLFSALKQVLAWRTGAVLDVGMNVGQTLLKCKILDPDREYFGFEPNPRAFNYATHFVELNQFRDCTLVPVGLSSRGGIATLLSNAGKDTDVSASLVEGFRPTYPYNRREIVPVFTGDELVEGLGIGSVAVVKVDVEGGELEVLEGMAALLMRDRPFVFCEVLPTGDPATETGAFRIARQSRLAEFLRHAGYQIFRLLPDAQIERVPAFGVHSDMSLTNYVFVAAAAADDFMRNFVPPED